MSLALVPRSARALAEHLNHYFRVLKGIDQDSIRLRLASGGGSFEIHHSATDAALFRVTDAGLVLPAAAVPAESITNVEIQDGTIRSFELQDGAVTSAKIADGTIQMSDLAANAVTVSLRVTGGTGGQFNSTVFADFDPAMNITHGSAGGLIVAFFFATVTSLTPGDYTTLGVAIGATDFIGTSHQPNATQLRGMAMAVGTAQPAAGAVVVKPRWRHSTAARNGASVSGEATLLMLELKR
jgi:hypothetical protein